MRWAKPVARPVSGVQEELTHRAPAVDTPCRRSGHAGVRGAGTPGAESDDREVREDGIPHLVATALVWQ